MCIVEDREVAGFRTNIEVDRVQAETGETLAGIVEEDDELTCILVDQEGMFADAVIAADAALS